MFPDVIRFSETLKRHEEDGRYTPVRTLIWRLTAARSASSLRSRIFFSSRAHSSICQLHRYKTRSR
jgi:hypothetical protein